MLEGNNILRSRRWHRRLTWYAHTGRVLPYYVYATHYGRIHKLVRRLPCLRHFIPSKSIGL